MKAKKKPKGTKAAVQAYKKRLQYIGTGITIAILIAIIAISTFLIYSYLNSPTDHTNNSDHTNNQPSQLKAAIVDHLSLSAPNQTFIETTTNTLEQAGYIVDYYPGEEVIIELYRNLATHGYGLIVLRVHSALALYGEEEMGYVDLFSSEPYSTTKYVYEQLTDQISKAMFVHGGPTYFAISPPFLQKSMHGRFNNATIIMMGCDGLTYTSMAQAFIEKGAKAYISWRGPVSASRTDQATTQLLKHLITEKQTIDEAVTQTMEEVGLDPAHNSILLYYPLGAGRYTT